MKVHSIVEESVASPRTGDEKSATLRPDLEGELLRRAIGHIMGRRQRSNRHGAFKGDSWPSAEDSPLQATPYVDPGLGPQIKGTFIGIRFQRSNRQAGANRRWRPSRQPSPRGRASQEKCPLPLWRVRERGIRWSYITCRKTHWYRLLMISFKYHTGGTFPHRGLLRESRGKNSGGDSCYRRVNIKVFKRTAGSGSCLT